MSIRQVTKRKMHIQSSFINLLFSLSKVTKRLAKLCISKIILCYSRLERFSSIKLIFKLRRVSVQSKCEQFIGLGDFDVCIATAYIVTIRVRVNRTFNLMAL